MNLSHGHSIICTSLATIRLSTPTHTLISTPALPFDVNTKFTLLAAGVEKRIVVGAVQDALWRRYSLTAPGVDCEVEETFANRETLFANPAGAQYWANKHMPDVIAKLHPSPMPSPRMALLAA